MPEFFVPGWTQSNGIQLTEEHHRYLARRCNAAVPADPARRIYSVTWYEAGERCVATVGQRLYNHGLAAESPEVPTPAPPGRDTDAEDPFVLVPEIFPGPAISVSTSGSLVRDPRLRWRNPIQIDHPAAIVYFDPQSPQDSPIEAGPAADSPTSDEDS